MIDFIEIGDLLYNQLYPNKVGIAYKISNASHLIFISWLNGNSDRLLYRREMKDWGYGWKLMKVKNA